MSEDNNDYETFSHDDFVFTTKDGQFIGGGFTVESMFLEKGISPITTFNNDDKQSGGKISSPFENLAVPAGLFYISQRTLKNKNEMQFNNERETISDDIFDKLFNMVNADKKPKKHTKRHKNKHNKLTKRRK